MNHNGLHQQEPVTSIICLFSENGYMSLHVHSAAAAAAINIKIKMKESNEIIKHAQCFQVLTCFDRQYHSIIELNNLSLLWHFWTGQQVFFISLYTTKILKCVVRFYLYCSSLICNDSELLFEKVCIAFLAMIVIPFVWLSLHFSHTNSMMNLKRIFFTSEIIPFVCVKRKEWFSFSK